MGRRKNGLLSLTKVEELVLIAIANLGDNAYGVNIRTTIESVGEILSMGAVYFALERLEKQGLLTSEEGRPLAERGGRARRYFALSGTGKETLRAVLNRPQLILESSRTRLGEIS